MKNVKLTIEYNGSRFFGWQKQKDRRTVQGELEKAVFLLTGQTVSVEGSGRTDSGVHALGQVANFFIESRIPIKNLKYALGNLLPEDIRIKKVESVPMDFHSRFSTKMKTYRYEVLVAKEPSAIFHDLLAFYPYKVSLELMKEGARLLLGEHDFRGFCATDTNVTNFNRKIFDITIKKKNQKYIFEITGNGFLYNMVRIIVGTLLDLGSGRLQKSDIEKALSTGERKYAGKTMPSCGLYLKKVKYVL